MRVGLKFETVVANIERFFALRDQISPECIVRVRGVSFHDTSNPDDVAAIERWEQFWRRLSKPHDRIYMKRAHNWGNQRIVEGHSPEYHWVWHPCVIPFSTMHITSAGKIGLCGQDYDAITDLDDITTASIAEVWQSEKFRQVREIHLSGRRNEIALCQGCRLFDEEFSLERNKDTAKGAAKPTLTATPEELAKLQLHGIKTKAKSLV